MERRRVSPGTVFATWHGKIRTYKGAYVYFFSPLHFPDEKAQV
jgi:hypothetical protein